MPTASAPPTDDQRQYATLPTPFTRALRTFLPWQIIRFAVINLRMLRLVWRSHHQPGAGH